jgi:MiaB-like tRNA modifying enzyme
MRKRAKPGKSFFLQTYGCTLNQSDSDAMLAFLRFKGFCPAQSEKEADVVVLNTCTVKSATEQKTMERIRKLVQQKKKIVIAGCLAINEGALKAAAPRAPIVYPCATNAIDRAVRAALKGKRAVFRTPTDKAVLPRVFSGVIAKIPIAEGCTGACTFCQTRLARGKLRSYAPMWVEWLVRHAMRRGAMEIQLTAQDTGAYGKDIGSSLPGLLSRLLAVEGPFLVRLGMINPEHALAVKEQLVAALSSYKFYRFLHIPVQSGSDEVLKSMARRYSAKEALDTFRYFRAKFPDMTLATDIIVGFPGEIEEDFGKTLAFLREARPDIVNVSKFTARPGTAAKRMKPLATQVVKRRSEIAAALCREIAERNNARFVGRDEVFIITEMQKTPTGRDINYRQVALVKGDARLGEQVKARITGARHSCLLAERI